MLKIIKDFPDYSISSHGEVVSFKRYKRGRKLKPKIDKDGYSTVTLYDGFGRGFAKRVHVLVAEAFVENPHNYDMVNHLDNDVSNNTLSNLEWCTNQHNQIHSIKTGNNNNAFPVFMYKDSIYIRSYNSARDAGRELGIDGSTISKVCRGERKGCGGYQWKYQKDIDTDGAEL